MRRAGRARPSVHAAAHSVAVALACWSIDALAYIDPGSGGFVLQMLLAALAAGGVWVGTRWRMLKDFLWTRFSRTRRGPDDPS
jgi:hypothetical protein